MLLLSEDLSREFSGHFPGRPCLNKVRSIYLIRLGLRTYYDYRISSLQTSLDEQQMRRDSTIEKLKTATKYNTTQDLLKKYGGTPAAKPKPAAGPTPKLDQRRNDVSVPKDGRTTVVPPPTANIPNNHDLNSQLNASQSLTSQSVRPLAHTNHSNLTAAQPQVLRPTTRQDSFAQFAPNAFSATPQYVNAKGSSRWYDRIMDVLLGEDETLPRARLALICSNCRLVNGQAPPGIKRLEDLGRWRCGGCGSTNGEEDEARKVVGSLEKPMSPEPGQITELKGPSPASGVSDGRSAGGKTSKTLVDDGHVSHETFETLLDHGHESDVTQNSSRSSEEDRKKGRVQGKVYKPIVEPETPRRRSTRSKGNDKKKS